MYSFPSWERSKEKNKEKEETDQLQHVKKPHIQPGSSGDEKMKNYLNHKLKSPILMSLKEFGKYVSKLVAKSNDVCGGFVEIRGDFPFLQQMANDILKNTDEFEKYDVTQNIMSIIKDSLFRHTMCASNYGDERDFSVEVDIIAQCVVYPPGILSLELMCVLSFTEDYRKHY